MKISLLTAFFVILSFWSNAQFAYDSSFAKPYYRDVTVLVNGREVDTINPDTIIIPVWSIVDKRPEFPDDLDKYLKNNFKYQKLEYESEDEGAVQIKFVVEMDGSLTHILVKKGTGDWLDNEALRLVKSMPKWKPAMHNLKAVRMEYVLLVPYKL